MERHNVKIVSIKYAAHNALRTFTEKPGYYQFTPGEATGVSINKEGFQTPKRAFPFTSLPDQDSSGFIFKINPSEFTEASINFADDKKLPGLMQGANFDSVFTGIETSKEK